MKYIKLSDSERVGEFNIPDDIIESADDNTFIVVSDSVELPKRFPDTHKGDYGRLFIVAGSVGYTGAPALCAKAASRFGAGLVYLGVPKRIYDILAVKVDEEMPFRLPDDNKGQIAANAASEILRRAKEADAALIGPGLGLSQAITELMASIVRLIKTPLILDADGINAIANDIDALRDAVCPLILTPHPGEFRRLGGDPSPGNRMPSARAFAKEYGCAIVLKGHRSISVFPDGSAYINTTGGPAMAKGGTGDVLAGMIAALTAQKFSVKDAVINSVYIHGLAGDLCAAEYGEYSVTASDIITRIPHAVYAVRS